MIRDYESLEVLDKHLGLLIAELGKAVYLDVDEKTPVVDLIYRQIVATLGYIGLLTDRMVHGQDRNLGEQGS